MQKYLNKLFTGDNIQFCKELPADCIDLIVTSPPYDNMRSYKNKQDEQNYNGYSFDFEGLAKELYRVMKPGGVIVWVVGDAIIKGSESLNSFRQALYFKEVGFNIHDTMIYQKTGTRFPEKTRYSQIFESMFVITKGRPKTVNIIKDRKNKWAGHTNWGHGGHRLKNGEMVRRPKAKPYAEYGSRFNIWIFKNGFGFSSKDKLAYKHPATFPEDLAGDHIKSWSNKGDVVFDPFMGSGTTAKMAILNDRKYIGVDISQEYTDLANERLAKLVNEKS
jgi:site-specific DNA-methyltransferase (adenine-specific)